MIPLRPLGATGLLVSPLGFGVSGAHGAGITPERQTHALVEAAYRSGVRMFDTAPFYGLAQARLGRALAALGAGCEAVVISKAGTVRRGGRLLKDFTPNGLQAAVERSLNELGRMQIDLLLLHGPPEEGLPGESWQALRALQAAGRVRAFGVCGRGREIAAAAADPLIMVVQAPVWSPWAAWCAGRGLPLLGIEALAGVEARRPLRLRGRADLWLLARKLKLRLAQGRNRGGEGDAAATAEPAAVLLRRALAAPGVCAIVTTTTRLEHLHQNLAVLADRAEIRA